MWSLFRRGCVALQVEGASPVKFQQLKTLAKLAQSPCGVSEGKATIGRDGRLVTRGNG